MDPPDRPTKHHGQPVILLSAFDGIGCAKLALDQAMARTDCWLMAYIAWEIDEDCCRLTANAHGAQHRGDFTMHRQSSCLALDRHAQTTHGSQKDLAEREQKASSSRSMPSG